MGRHVPIDLRTEIEEVPAHGGVIFRKDMVLKLGSLEDRPDWPEAMYLSVHHTTETPIAFPLEQRVQAQIAAVEALLKALEKKKCNYPLIFSSLLQEWESGSSEVHPGSRSLGPPRGRLRDLDLRDILLHFPNGRRHGT
jgi:hypothetical protein